MKRDASKLPWKFSTSSTWTKLLVQSRMFRVFWMSSACRELYEKYRTANHPAIPALAVDDLSLSFCIVDLNDFGKWPDLFNHLGGIADDHHRGAIRRHILFSYILNLFGGNCVDAIPVRVQEIARQVQHVDADKLIDQAVLRFDSDGKDATEVSLGVTQLLVRHPLRANALQLEEKLTQGSFGHKRAHLGRDTEGAGQAASVKIRIGAVGIAFFFA